jgi:hypothetical protein
MTGTSAKNHSGIFSTKRTKNLAEKYGLDLYNKNAYMYSGKFITYDDVQFIVDNLWLDYFMGYSIEQPDATISTTEKLNIIDSLRIKFPDFDYSLY